MAKMNVAAGAGIWGTLMLIVLATVVRAAPPLPAPPARTSTPTSTSAAAGTATPAATEPVGGANALEGIAGLLTPWTAPAFPMTFPNERLLEEPDSRSLTAAIDPQAMRPAAADDDAGSGPAADAAAPAAPVVVRALSTPRAVGGRFFTVPAKPLHGKKIRISGWLKTQDLQNWAGLGVVVMGPDGRCDAADMMSGRAIYGTTAWREYSSVVEVLPDSQALVIGVGLTGTGTVWADGFQITLADDGAACTDDRNWHIFACSPAPGVAERDEKVRRDGHPTTRFSVPRTPQRYAYYDRGDRSVEPYLGKRIKMTAWLKCENVTGPSGLSIHVNGASFRKIADDNTHGHRPLRGTMDWQKYEAIANVPAEAQSIFSGLELIGAGTIWIDDVKLEVVGP